MPYSKKNMNSFVDQMIGLNAAKKSGIEQPKLRDPDQFFGMFTGLGGDGIMEESQRILYARLTLPPSEGGSGPVVGETTL